jgi:hypothetical protein
MSKVEAEFGELSLRVKRGSKNRGRLSIVAALDRESLVGK